jgi:hypothetical protein
MLERYIVNAVKSVSCPGTCYGIGDVELDFGSLLLQPAIRHLRGLGQT